MGAGLFNRLTAKLTGGGQEGLFDDRVPTGYVLRFMIGKATSMLYGFILFKRMTRSFVNHTSKIKMRRQIKYGKNLNIERGCFINALSVNGIEFGSNVSIGKYTTIECTGSLRSIGKGLVVGNGVGMGTHGFFGCAGGIEIGNDTIFGNYVSMHSENHIYDDLSLPIKRQGVTRKGIRIGCGCWIGAKATILDGTVIGIIVWWLPAQ